MNEKVDTDHDEDAEKYGIDKEKVDHVDEIVECVFVFLFFGYMLSNLFNFGLSTYLLIFWQFWCRWGEGHKLFCCGLGKGHQGVVQSALLEKNILAPGKV